MRKYRRHYFIFQHSFKDPNQTEKKNTGKFKVYLFSKKSVGENLLVLVLLYRQTSSQSTFLVLKAIYLTIYR